jgi:hypothetical protein
MTKAETVRVRVDTKALTGVRAFAFLNVTAGHFVFLMAKSVHVDLMGKLQKKISLFSFK